MLVEKVSKKAIRRFLIERCKLNSQKTTKGYDGFIRLTRALECVQLDPVANLENNHHLVYRARQSDYKDQYHNDALLSNDVFEYFANAACIMPISDYPLFKPTRDHYYDKHKACLKTYQNIVKNIIDRISREGPLLLKDFDTTVKVNGSWDNKKANTKITSHLISLLYDAGILRVVGRENNQKCFDLSEASLSRKLYKKSKDIKTEECELLLFEKFMRAYRVFDIRDPRFGWDPSVVKKKQLLLADYLEKKHVMRLNVEGVDTTYYCLTSDFNDIYHYEISPYKASRAIRFLPPLDNLLWHRNRLNDFFDFNYKWEIYTPKSQRVFGSYAMPVLYGDKFVGKIDPRTIPDDKQLYINNIQFEDNLKLSKSLLDATRTSLLKLAKSVGRTQVKVTSSFHPDLSAYLCSI